VIKNAAQNGKQLRTARLHPRTGTPALLFTGRDRRLISGEGASSTCGRPGLTVTREGGDRGGRTPAGRESNSFIIQLGGGADRGRNQMPSQAIIKTSQKLMYLKVVQSKN